MNLAYRDFTRIGLGKVPDAKILARMAGIGRRSDRQAA
jgi:hypothetical protein